MALYTTSSQSDGDNRWPKVSRERPCPKCTHVDRCKVAPDGHAGWCWRNGGLWHDGSRAGPSSGGTAYVGQAHRPKPRSTLYPSAEDAIAAAGRHVAGGTLTTSWTYRDAAGAEVMRVARFDLPDGGKQFRPVHVVEGGWRIGDPPGPLPIYLLPEIPADGPIYLCEGEKAAEAGRSTGLPTVTSAHGSSGASKTNWSPLAGRDVVILPDNDEPGEKYAREVSAILASLSPPARVKVVCLPGLPASGDVFDYVEMRDSQDSEDIAASIVTLAEGTPWIDSATNRPGPVRVRMSDVEARDVCWLWEGRVPLGRITLVVGRPGEGKSYLTIFMAGVVSTGAVWPDGTSCAAGSVLIISAEDDPHDTIRPRLDAHGADCGRVHLLSMVRRVDEKGEQREVMFTLADVATLESALQQLPDCRLIIIDPIGSYLGGDADAHRDNEVRSILAPLAKLAEKYGCAVVIVCHRRKAGGASADDLAMGSRGFVGLARSVWHLSRDKDDKSRRLLLPGKSNLSAETSGLAFTIAGDPPAIVWEAEPVAMHADDALAAEGAAATADCEKRGPAPTARNAAGEWLRELLAGGEVDAARVKGEAASAGLGWRTVQRAADELDVKREKNRFSGGWQWRLPKGAAVEDATSRANSPSTEQLGILASSQKSGETGHFSMTPGEDAKFDHLGIFDQSGGGK